MKQRKSKFVKLGLGTRLPAVCMSTLKVCYGSKCLYIYIFFLFLAIRYIFSAPIKGTVSRDFLIRFMTLKTKSVLFVQALIV